MVSRTVIATFSPEISKSSWEEGDVIRTLYFPGASSVWYMMPSLSSSVLVYVSPEGFSILTSKAMLEISLPVLLLTNLIFKSFWIEERFSFTCAFLPSSGISWPSSSSQSSGSMEAAITFAAWASAIATSPSSPIILIPSRPTPISAKVSTCFLMFLAFKYRPPVTSASTSTATPVNATA